MLLLFLLHVMLQSQLSYFRIIKSFAQRINNKNHRKIINIIILISLLLLLEKKERWTERGRKNDDDA